VTVNPRVALERQLWSKRLPRERALRQFGVVSNRSTRSLPRTSGNAPCGSSSSNCERPSGPNVLTPSRSTLVHHVKPDAERVDGVECSRASGASRPRRGTRHTHTPPGLRSHTSSRRRAPRRPSCRHHEARTFPPKRLTMPSTIGFGGSAAMSASRPQGPGEQTRGASDRPCREHTARWPLGRAPRTTSPPGRRCRVRSVRVEHDGHTHRAKNDFVSAASSCSPSRTFVPPMKMLCVSEILRAARKDAAWTMSARTAVDAAIAHHSRAPPSNPTTRSKTLGCGALSSCRRSLRTVKTLGDRTADPSRTFNGRLKRTLRFTSTERMLRVFGPGDDVGDRRLRPSARAIDSFVA